MRTLTSEEGERDIAQEPEYVSIKSEKVLNAFKTGYRLTGGKCKRIGYSVPEDIKAAYFNKGKEGIVQYGGWMELKPDTMQGYAEQAKAIGMLASWFFLYGSAITETIANYRAGLCVEGGVEPHCIPIEKPVHIELIVKEYEKKTTIGWKAVCRRLIC